MVRERKSKKYDIEKIHELIDSVSFSKERKNFSYKEKNLESVRKQLSEELVKAKKKMTSSDLFHTKSESLTPRIVIHKREDIQKKEEKIIQIGLEPKTEEKQKSPGVENVIPSTEDFFAEEPLYEIEKVAVGEVVLHIQPIEVSEKSAIQKEFTPIISVRGQAENHLPEWEPVAQNTAVKEITDHEDEKKAEAFLPEFERVDEKQAPLPPPFPEGESKIPSFEQVEFEVTRREKPKIDELEVKKKEKEEKRRKKMEEKQARQEAKEKERETIRLTKEHDKKLQIEQLEVRKKQKEEQRLKDEEKKKAATETREKERETIRLTKEHDKKLQIEQLEVRKKQKEEQRLKDEEKKKAVAEAKEKDREEQRSLKERQQQLQIEKAKLRKKEKEEKKQRKFEEEIKTAVAALVVQKETVPEKTPSEGFAPVEQEEIHEKPLPPQKEEQPKISEWGSREEEIHPDVGEIPAKPKEPPARETIDLFSKEKEREQKHLKKEQKEKQRLERPERKKKEKEDKQRKKLEEKQLGEQLKLEKIDKEERKRKKLEEKHVARREAKEKRCQEKKQAKDEQRQKQLTLALKERESRMKENEGQKQKKFVKKMEKDHLNKLVIGKATEPRVEDEREKAEEQKLEKEGERSTAKEQRKLKAVERKMQKEREKKEKEIRKSRALEKTKAKKTMDLHFKEEIIKEKLSGTEEQIDVFDGFDNIDHKTAILFQKNGYTSVEKLREATVKDLMKIGIKKKTAQKILAESKEFVEWEVLGADDHPEGKI